LGVYDDIPYESVPVPGTSPEWLAAVSAYHGGPLPRLAGGRVLEVGCGDGANLLPLAAFRDDMRFVGLDSSAAALGRAASDSGAIGLDNLELREADLRAPGDLGTFDTILAHGVLSWVPPDAREALFALCARHLAADGIAFLSYNAQPGWGVRGRLREYLRAHADGPAAARELAARLRAVVAQTESSIAGLLDGELARLESVPDGYLAHEMLAEFNHAYWHGEFVAAAESHGLCHAANAWFNRPEGRCPDELAQLVGDAGFADRAAVDTADLLGYRRFRAAILARPDACGAPDHAALLARARVAAALTPTGDGAFVAGDGTRFDVPDPDVARVLTELRRAWPRSLPSVEFDGALDLYRQGYLELRLRELPPASGAAPRALTRLEAKRRGYVTTPTHETLPCPDPDAARDALLAWGLLC
jgi:SAM-dependent methyltransferase